MKKVFKILTLIMLILTILTISDTYAKYYLQATTNTLNEEVGQWVIKVNELDIFSEYGESVEFEVENFNNFTNTNSAPDTISPSSTGELDIVIDPEGTDVAVRYDIVLDLSGITDLAISARLENDSGDLIQTGENSYSGIISLSDVQAGNKANMTCYITWANDENKNAEDTLAGSTYGTYVNFTANVTVTQYLGETITPYTPGV